LSVAATNRASGIDAHEHIDTVAAHRVVGPRGGVERIGPARMTRRAATIHDRGVVEIPNGVEHVVHARLIQRKNAPTRMSASASASISSTVV
jgi:hypothetical protein